jgi:hypothetical protein
MPGKMGSEESVMAQVGNNENLGGPYMVQDRDHMSKISPATDKAKRSGVRQQEQSHESSRQQGNDDHSGGSRRSVRRRQAE